MKREQLPPLHARGTRVRLLAWSRIDALTTGSQDGGGSDAHGSRLVLHGDLWPQGSYHELERAMRGEQWFADQYVDRKLHEQPNKSLELDQVTNRMPANIYVPPEISEAAGYLPSEAKTYGMPRAEQRRRRDRRR